MILRYFALFFAIYAVRLLIASRGHWLELLEIPWDLTRFFAGLAFAPLQLLWRPQYLFDSISNETAFTCGRFVGGIMVLVAMFVGGFFSVALWLDGGLKW